MRPGDRLRGARRVIGRAMRRDGLSVGRARGHECAAGHGWSECREFASWSLLFCVCVCVRVCARTWARVPTTVSKSSGAASRLRIRSEHRADLHRAFTPTRLLPALPECPPARRAVLMKPSPSPRPNPSRQTPTLLRRTVVGGLARRMPARRRLFERHRMIGTRPSSMLGDRLGRSAASPHLDIKPRAARDCRRIPARRAFRRPCKGVVARGAHGKRGAARFPCAARIPLTARGRFGAWRGSLPAWRKSSNVSLLRRGVIRSQRRPAASFDSVGDAARCPRGDARDRIDPSPARTAAHRAHARAPRLRAAAAAVAAATAAGHCGCESAPRARRFAADRQEKGIARTHCAIARRAIST